jgi:hypothetical protein
VTSPITSTRGSVFRPAAEGLAAPLAEGLAAPLADCDTIDAWWRSNGAPIATIQSAATVKPPTISHLRRLTATGAAGGTLSSSWGTSTVELGTRSSAECGCVRGIGSAPMGFVDSGTR